ncbi:MAG: hypothetical protein HF978_20910 [Desulfobacteraceae bacterium]|nr:hypothetical protein [Desulfobacteraceae bacterium]MBC2758010.1 hypothetical protein [Desulfobacteraceae bacterium]
MRDSNDPRALLTALISKATPIKKGTTPSSDYYFESFEVLGITDDERIVIWSSIGRTIFDPTIDKLTLDFMHIVGQDEVANRVSRKLKNDKVMFSTLKKLMLIEAAKNRLGDLSKLGQGIHCLKSGRLLLVNGGEAFLWDGTTVKVQDHPLIEGKLIDWKPGSEWTDITEVIDLLKKMNADIAKKMLDEIISQVDQWEFTGRSDSLLITGWMLAQIVQTAWKWRPHLWISGSQGSGKSYLTMLADDILGGLCLRKEGNGLTEAGLRQSIFNHAKCVIIDEFEQSDHREKIIEILRSAGRGGYITKGSVSQTAVNFKINHMVMVCSIETGLIRAAEKNRYLLVQTNKNENVKPKLPTTDKANELQKYMLAYALWAIWKAKDAITRLPHFQGQDNRWIESVSVPFSMLASCTDDPAGQLTSMVSFYLNDQVDRLAEEVEEDETALLDAILMSTIRLPIEVEAPSGSMSAMPKTIYDIRTVGQIINDLNISDAHDKTLHAHGIRLSALKTGENYLAMHAIVVKKKLLSNTRWAKLNIRDILMRIPGAIDRREYIAGVQNRCILIPLEQTKVEIYMQ